MAAMRIALQCEHRISVRFPRDRAFQRTPPASQTERDAPQVQQRMRQFSDEARMSSAHRLGMILTISFCMKLKSEIRFW
jgi:hypothetical protein